jgi:hypothetical protein
MIEEEYFRNNKGKWSQKGIPHTGWKCVDIEDMGETVKNM